jgi:RHS repeat-associated protein
VRTGKDSVIHGLDVTTYAYGLAGELTTMRVTPSALGGSRSFTFTFTSDALGRIRRIQYPVQNITVDYRYDARGLLRRVVSRRPAARTGGADLLDLVFKNDSVDALGRVLQEETLCPGANTSQAVAGSPCGTAFAGQGPVGRVRTFNRAGWLVLDRDLNAVAADSMQFDMSGNMAYRRKYGQFAHTFTMDAGAHNRLALDHYVQGSSQLNMYSVHDLDGNRVADTASTRDTGYYNDRFTYYDALGRLYTPIRHHQLPDGSVQWDPWAERCHYDPDGQAVVMCESGIAVSLDGGNHSGTLGNAPWRFWGTGALDSPLMAMQKSANGSTALVLFVTDGAGRQFVAADSNGTQFSSPNDGGWTYTGGTGTTASFDSDRLSAGQQAGISYFRNRTYDMNTGRWMQEDPIGIAGGDNLYQFNGNNPVTFTDPFGLIPCDPPGSCEAQGAVAGTEAGLSAGLAISAACDAGTLGACAITNPLIIAGTTLIGATVGLAVGTYNEFAGNSGKTAPGQTAGGRATDEHGNVLGPSGEVAHHEVRSANRKQAKDRAKEAGKRAPEHHPSPARGDPHYHPTGPDGNKAPGSPHYTYPE